MEHTAVGVGTELLANDAELFPGAAVALLPPVSGGGGTPRIQEGPLSLSELVEATDGVDDGALVVFSGNVRASEDGRPLSGLDYDVHRDMADAVIRGIEADLMQRDGVLACRIVHRVGFVPVGESSVYVVVRARHRPEGFEAARDGIDRVKREAPIWKEDVFLDGARAPHLGDDATPLARASERAGIASPEVVRGAKIELDTLESSPVCSPRCSSPSGLPSPGTNSGSLSGHC
jgi:MoaE-MoaD fusion protein